MVRKSRNNNPNNKLLYDPNQREQRRLGAFSMEENNADEIISENIDEESLNNDETTNLEKSNNPQTQNVSSSIKNIASAGAEEAGLSKAVAGKVAMKLGAFIAAHPWILFFVGGIALLFMIIIIFGGAAHIEENNNNVQSNSYSSSCSAISLNTTTLSKDEFVEKVQAYFANSSSVGGKIFSENADSIYGIAVQNNINPELVVIRAIAEGFSPGASKNNYWGMGCSTGSVESCISYSSFDEGVLKFVQNISQYENVNAMMSKYAYIGTYWYNPGSSAIGGCYYYNYIKEYMSSTRSSEVANICNGNSCDINGGETCTRTTDEDQEAYAKYQVSFMAASRKNVFGLEPDNCEQHSSSSTTSANCTIFAQGDSRWSAINLGNSSSTMGGAGCAVTSVAIGISCSGTPVTVESFDPGVFVKVLNQGNCFTDEGYIKWACPAIKTIAPNVNFVASITDIGGYSIEQKVNLVNSYDTGNSFIILHLSRGHYVVYTERAGDYFVTKDPGVGQVRNHLISEIDQIVIYKY